jgi:predicted branched-subunit amino acid permease
MPPSLSLDYAIPLSFVALVLPTLKNRNYFYVAAAASILSVLLKPLPYNLGLLCAALIAMAIGTFLTRGRYAD